MIAGAIGISSSAIVTKMLVELRRLDNPETPADPRHHRHRGPLPGAVPGRPRAGARARPRAPARRVAAVRQGGRLPGRARSLLARFGAPSWARLLDTDDDELLVVTFVGHRPAGRRHRATALGLSDAIGAFLAGLVIAPTVGGGPRAEAGAARCATRSPPSSSSPSACPSTRPTPRIGGRCPRWPAPRPLVRADPGRRHRSPPGIHDWDRMAAANIGLTTLARGRVRVDPRRSLAVAAGLDRRMAPFVALYVLVLAVGPARHPVGHPRRTHACSVTRRLIRTPELARRLEHPDGVLKYAGRSRRARHQGTSSGVEVVAALADHCRTRNRSRTSAERVAHHVHRRRGWSSPPAPAPRPATAGTARRGGTPRRRTRTRRRGVWAKISRATSERNALSPHCVSRYLPSSTTRVSRLMARPPISRTPPGPHEGGGVVVAAAADHDVPAVLDLLEQVEDLVGRVGQVGVGERHGAPPGRQHRRRAPPRPCPGSPAGATHLVGARGLGQPGGAVVRAVVDHDDLERRRRSSTLVQVGLRQAAARCRRCGPPAEGRHDHR